MRRALLLAVLAVPPLAAAQTTTTPTLTFTQGSTDIIHGKWISLAECLASKSTPDDPSAEVNLGWVLTTFPAGGSYQVYASTAAITGTTCPISDSTNPQFSAGPVGANLGNLGPSVVLQPIRFADVFTAVKTTIADCAAVSGDTPIYICVQAMDSARNNVGIVTGQLILSITAPGAPTGLSAVPADDGALQIGWSAPGGSPQAYDYVVTATDGTADPTPHTVSDLVSLDYLMRGLVNGATYDITVVARTNAGNPGPAATTSGTPVHVVNFWDLYHNGYGGKEQGGCSAGGAGPIALLGLAALLAVLRRRG